MGVFQIEEGLHIPARGSVIRRRAEGKADVSLSYPDSDSFLFFYLKNYLLKNINLFDCAGC